jgi:hypothetical protein
MSFKIEELLRLEETRDGKKSWKKWGPYLSERQWGTVREDYSENGDAWNFFTHDQARSRAYRWGEDGLGGIPDDKQRLWFRNDWASWVARPSEKPMLKQIEGPAGTRAIAAAHPILGEYFLYWEGEAPLLFTENETNHARLSLDYPDAGPYLKDGINDYVVHGQQGAVNPANTGKKV